MKWSPDLRWLSCPNIPPELAYLLLCYTTPACLQLIYFRFLVWRPWLDHQTKSCALNKLSSCLINSHISCIGIVNTFQPPQLSLTLLPRRSSSEVTICRKALWYFPISIRVTWTRHSGKIRLSSNLTVGWTRTTY